MHFVVLVEIDVEEIFKNLRPEDAELSGNRIDNVDAHLRSRIEDQINYQLEPFDQNNSDYYTKFEESCCTNADCTVCSGTNHQIVEYNECGLYDWYALGGRWAGTAHGLVHELSILQIRKVGALFPDLRNSTQYVIHDSQTMIDDPQEWLTNPENVDKYVAVVDCHS